MLAWIEEGVKVLDVWQVVQVLGRAAESDGQPNFVLKSTILLVV